MLKILVTPKEIVCFPRQGLRWEAVGDQWSGMASHMSHKCYTVSSRLPRAASLTVLGEGSELKTGSLSNQKRLTASRLKHPVSPKGVLVIAKLLL